ncbi:serine/threonine protein kinase [Cylindrospermum sp. FACHB-282]|uniref:serine/threonine protein kinase n=1 Tax=Cylindrospermum sp. FACHB-282 TaxID=2692794 RepID=UPI0021045AEB|nr:serine/threonine-protein kinase [Cylindrospermum sp. FACHB-282]
MESMFLQEAVKLARFRHPHIVSVEAPFKQDSHWCLAMEYIDGISLGDRNKQVLSESQALTYIQQIGEALILVHENQLIHRDIRPENIMLRVRDGKPEAVLIDFSLALDFDHTLTTARTRETSEGFTPLELYSQQGQPTGAYTDIYSLAATLYVLLTGKIPVSAIKRKLDKKPFVNPKKLNSQISDRTNRQILEGMKLDAKKRPQSVREWLDALGLTSANAAPDTSPAKSEPKINWSVIWTAAGVIVTLLVGIPAWIGIFKPSPDNPPAITPSPAVTQKPSPDNPPAITPSPAVTQKP